VEGINTETFWRLQQKNIPQSKTQDMDHMFTLPYG